jgi:hypothetical protein
VTSPRWGRGATQASPAPMAAALPRGHRRCAPRRLKSTPTVHPSTPQTLAGRPFKSNPCLLSLFRLPWGKLPPNSRPRPRSRAGARRSREEGGEGGGEKRVEVVPGNRRPVELYLDAKPVRAAEVALVPELCGRGHFEGSAALGTPPSTGPRGTGTAQAKDDPAPFLCSERPLYFRLHCHRSAFFTDACTSASGHRGEADLPCTSVEARPSSRGQKRPHQVTAFLLSLELVVAPCSFPCRFGPGSVAVTKLQPPNHGQEHTYHLLDKMPGEQG